MTSVVRTRLAWAGVLAASGMCWPHAARAAALVASEQTTPSLTVETALIVWHPDTKVEHLIVGVRAERVDGRYAYLVAVPGVPSVRSIDEDLSLSFARLIKDYRARTPGWELPSLAGGRLRPWLAFGGSGHADAIVDKCGEASGMADTLRARGFVVDAAVQEWLLACTGQSAHVVALQGAGEGTVRTLPFTRIEFASDRPYYPYREPSRPADEIEGSHARGATARLLRIYVLTTEPVAMRIGSSMPSLAQAWLSYEPTHGELKAALGAGLYGATGVDEAKRYWITSFEDYHVVRPGNDDVWFDRLGAIPKDGAPGTVGDRAGQGVALMPMEPPPEMWLEEASSGPGGDTGREARPPSVGVRRSKKAATLALFGGMVAVALGCFWWASAKRV